MSKKRKSAARMTLATKSKLRLHRQISRGKVLLFLGGFIVIGCILPFVRASQTASVLSTPPPNIWPAIYHKAGSYGYPRSTSEASLAKSLGISYFITSRAVEKYDIDIVALQTWGLIHRAWESRCDSLGEPKQYHDTDPPCSLMDKNGNKTPEELTLEKDFSDYLAGVGNDPHVIGYYILDDPPAGNFGGSELKYTLIEMHKLVVAANAKSSVKRFTYCAFDISPHHWYNFSPQSCDIVGIYHYRSSDQSALFNKIYTDPTGFSSWNANVQGLVGTGQTVTEKGGLAIGPTSDEISTQMASFCWNGAISLAPYTWRTNSGTSDLATTPAYQAGFKQGLDRCKAIWANGVGITDHWKPGSPLVPSHIDINPPPTPTTTPASTPTSTLLQQTTPSITPTSSHTSPPPAQNISDVPLAAARVLEHPTEIGNLYTQSPKRTLFWLTMLASSIPPVLLTGILFYVFDILGWLNPVKFAYGKLHSAILPPRWR